MGPITALSSSACRPVCHNGQSAALLSGLDTRSFTKVNSLGLALGALHLTRSDRQAIYLLRASARYSGQRPLHGTDSGLLRYFQPQNKSEMPDSGCYPSDEIKKLKKNGECERIKVIFTDRFLTKLFFIMRRVFYVAATAFAAFALMTACDKSDPDGTGNGNVENTGDGGNTGGDDVTGGAMKPETVLSAP